MTPPRTSPASRRAGPLATLLLAVGGVLTGAGCATSGLVEPELPRDVAPADALDDVEAALAAGRAGDALTTVAAVQNERNLAPELRNASDAAAERAVAVLEADAQAPEGRWSAEQLEVLARLDLPLRQRARVAVAAGRAHLREGSRILAFKYLRDFEQANPGHPEGAAASDVVAEAGFALIEDPGRYALFRRYRSRGIGALELLVLRYPSHPRCAEAYAALAEAYVEREDLDLAVERLEDLLLYHPRDPRAPTAEAELPRLRMARVDRDDFDRSELERARAELEAWLDRYEGAAEVDPELAERVRGDHVRCLLRLASNDLVVARFYRRVDVPFGVRQHAERALALARGAAELASGAQLEEADAAVRTATALLEDADEAGGRRRERADEADTEASGLDPERFGSAPR